MKRQVFDMQLRDATHVFNNHQQPTMIHQDEEQTMLPLPQ
jgi:hypothetical protein